MKKASEPAPDQEPSKANEQILASFGVVPVEPLPRANIRRCEPPSCCPQSSARPGLAIRGMSGRPDAVHLGQAADMRAELKALGLEPDPSTLPEDPEHFVLLARIFAGPADGPGEESFDVTVCSPEWLAATCSRVGLYDARHHVVVAVDQFDRRELHRWLENRVRAVTGEAWDEIGAKLARLGHWKFEDYREKA